MRYFFAFVCLTLSLVALASERVKQRRVVFDNAHSATPYRIPALAQLQDGSLLAVCDFRFNKADIGWRGHSGSYRVDIVAKRSSDGGRTWSDTIGIVRGTDNVADGWRAAYGDASLVADRTSNSVLLHVVAGTTPYTQATRSRPQHAVFFRSDDGGRTWDKGHDLTEAIYGLYDGTLADGGVADGLFITSGRIMQSRYVRVGRYYRLYVAHPLRRVGHQRWGTYVLFSDDFGRSWQVLGSPAYPAAAAQDESKVEELPDGSVLLSCRDVQGGRTFNRFVYDDARRATGAWGREVMPSAMTHREVNACNGDVLVVGARRMVDGQAVYLILQSVPLSPKREKVGFFYKELATLADYATPQRLAADWHKGLQVTEETSCYSTLVSLANDSIGILYEEREHNRGYDIVYKQLSVEEITNGRYTYDPLANREPFLLDATAKQYAYKPTPAEQASFTPAWQALPAKLHVAWHTDTALVSPWQVPTATHQDTALYLWRGERGGVMAVLYAAQPYGTLHLRVKSREKAVQRAVRAHWLRYVVTDSFRGCGDHPKHFRPWLVPDVIDHVPTTHYVPRMVQPIWVGIDVPHTLAAGTYPLVLEVTDMLGQVLQTLPLTLHVDKRKLPAPQYYTFDTHYWLQPYAVSRYYGVKPWSKAHFELLKPYIQLLARSGQTAASAILFYEPWGRQSNDKFDAMIATTRKADGTWAYDYTTFDRWVEFVTANGLVGRINCFSMVPWDMSFTYYDEATARYVTLKTGTDKPEYTLLWRNFIAHFAAHLKAKGWFERTVIGMDERSLEDMLRVYTLVQQAAPGMKMALAGNYHPELVDKIYDYCIAWGQNFTPEELALRQSRGWISTLYTACPDAEPNVCSNNIPADARHIPQQVSHRGYDGFLRWSWLNWTDNPLLDTRFDMFTPGDTYMIYPGARSSIRYEKYMQGVQAVEKNRLIHQARRKGY